MSPVYDSLSTATIVLHFDVLSTANLCFTASTTLLFYDYLLTLSDEIRCIWRAKFSTATVLFILSRYATISYRIFMLVQYVRWQGNTKALSDSTCTSILRFNESLIVLLELIAAVFMSLRLYAIWSTNWVILISILLCGLVEPICNIYNYSTMTIASIPSIAGCGQVVDPSNQHALFLSRFGPSWAIGSHGLVLVLTWIKTAGIVWSFLTLKSKTSLGALLLRDGSVYFVLLLSLNILLALEHSALNTAAGAMADVVVSVLLSRFILNLRRVYFSLGDGIDAHDSKFSSVRFARSITGNLGAPLNIAENMEIRMGGTGWSREEAGLESESEGVRYVQEPILVDLQLPTDLERDV